MMYDLLIQNGRIIDGTGSPAMYAEIAVKDGKIVKIARHIPADATTVIDATGKVVTPGFIDSHSHSDKEFFSCPGQAEKVEQGITTSVAGQCGSSVCSADASAFLENARGCALGANMAMLIGHGSLRRAVIGSENREPTQEELEKMKALMRDAMEHGALGVSFGLIYAPGCFAKTSELVEIAKIVGAYHGIAAIHLRSENDRLVEAVNEFVSIVRQSSVRGVVSHHKVSGLSEHWGKVHTTLRIIDQANADGLEIYADVYPYTASSTRFSQPLIPANWRSGGIEALLNYVEDPRLVAEIKADYAAKYPHMQWIMVSHCPGYPEYQGLRIPEIAALRGQDDFDAAMDIVRLTRDEARGCFFSMCEEDLETVLAHPRAMICTDSGVLTTSTSYHPRLRASFPRTLARYVRERGVTTLPEMIRKMTAMPAAVYGFQPKGLLRESFDADICIFDPDAIQDRATYANPHERAEGLDYVIVGGKIAAVNAVATGALGGTMLYRSL